MFNVTRRRKVYRPPTPRVVMREAVLLKELPTKPRGNVSVYSEIIKGVR